MKNEYGDILDRNGYAPSIIGNHAYCAICFRSNSHLQRHEVFHGANRQKSKRYGIWLNVCPQCHNEIHFSNGMLDKRLKEYAQRQACAHYGWSKEDFKQRFGKNYLLEEL